MPAHVDRLTWNSACHHNLVTYLLRPEIRALGKPAVVVKACDERALVILQRESQLRREDVYVIGSRLRRSARAGTGKVSLLHFAIAAFCRRRGRAGPSRRGTSSRHDLRSWTVSCSSRRKNACSSGRRHCSGARVATLAGRSVRCVTVSGASWTRINRSASTRRQR